jgi:hypothetical protein
MTYVAPTGALGSGVDRASLWAALEERPAFIAADAGTTDFAGTRGDHDLFSD